MSTYFGIDSSAVGTLFSGMNKSDSMGGTSGSILSEYYNIKSGAYKKVLNAYYSKVENTKSEGTTTTAASSDTAKTLTNIKSSANEMADAAAKLVKSNGDSVFKKIQTKDANGDSSMNYDVDGIYKKVSDFVKKYNDMLDKAGESSTSNINNSLKNIMNYTDKNEKLLSEIGISIDKDGDLKLDENKFKTADMATVKSVFNGTGSYAYNIQSKASMMAYYADVEANKANTYTASGGYSYNYSTGDIINSFT